MSSLQGWDNAKFFWLLPDFWRNCVATMRLYLTQISICLVRVDQIAAAIGAYVHLYPNQKVSFEIMPTAGLV